jgi:putative transposase
MPEGLQRFQQARDLHFVTFSCYQRRPLLGEPARRDLFVRSLEEMHRLYRFFVTGYVVMPEHVHLLISEPGRAILATAIQALKQSVARRSGGRIWQERYHDFNVWNRDKIGEKLDYMHRNPVVRGLVASPDQWRWSSCVHYLTGVRGVVEIESHWTAKERELRGEVPRLTLRVNPTMPRPSKTS